MNQSAAFEEAVRQLRKLERLTNAGDEKAKNLHEAYQNGSLAVLGIPLREFLAERE